MINLLTIEYMSLSLLMLYLIIMMNNNFDMFFIMMFLTFIVCEGVLGLCMMISMVRNFGNNNLLNLFYLKI